MHLDSMPPILHVCVHAPGGFVVDKKSAEQRCCVGSPGDPTFRRLSTLTYIQVRLDLHFKVVLHLTTKSVKLCDLTMVS